MKTIKIYHLLAVLTLATVFSACHKDKDNVTPDTPTAQRAGIYIMNQGGFTYNNGSLTYYDYTTKKLTPDIFSTVNNKGLGDTPNDIKVYGSKIYIVVNYSSYLEVADAKTAKEVKRIPLLNGTIERQPRDIVFNKNKAYISNYDGTVAVLDTASLSIDTYINVGHNPEQMVISNGKLYVANSGGLGITPDNTVSVVNLTTLTETKKITVIANPVSMGADAYGNVYVLSTGVFDYATNTVTVAPGMSIIDNNADVLKSQNTESGSFNTAFIVNGDNAYFLNSNGKVEVYNVKTQAVASSNFITDGTAIAAPYNISYDSLTGELFVTDAKDYSSNGALFAFDKNGKKEYSIVTGISPAGIAFVNK